MYCRFCGKEIPEGARFCINCGKEVDVAETSTSKSSAPEPSLYGTAQAPSPVNPGVVVIPAQIYHLGCFKFIIYCQLFANAAFLTYTAVTCFFGLA